MVTTAHQNASGMLLKQERSDPASAKYTADENNTTPVTTQPGTWSPLLRSPPSLPPSQQTTLSSPTPSRPKQILNNNSNNTLGRKIDECTEDATWPLAALCAEHQYVHTGSRHMTNTYKGRKQRREKHVQVMK
ncbi:hypothetical protein E2C01_082328 [Portunus trituberculatus]|uniref:Uncharacterized protein n=1 Tax=Portunus trituberculatus TaxID=210409 RepID=A0A5B7IY57_PORTR|nr:hypothetical protein [Portunus trituberculatus]